MIFTKEFIIACIATAVISYLLGSCNSAIIVCKLMKGQDIRTLGSKNAGLTNTLRVFGKVPALFTLIGDLSKGIIAVLLSRLIFSLLNTGLPLAGGGYDTIFVGYLSGIFAIIGHIFPIYYGFKGGKGILVSSSILLVIDPLTFCIIIPFFALILFITRYVSVSSITSAVFYPILTYILQSLRGFPNIWVNVSLVIVTSIILIYMHHSNIKRLIEGTENKFSFGKKKK